MSDRAPRLQLGMHILFFAIFGAYVAWVADVGLLEQRGAAVLGLWTAESLATPAGAIRWVAVALSPALARPLVAAALFTLVAMAVCLAMRDVLRRAAGRGTAASLHFLPIAGMALLLAGGHFQFATGLALVAALAAAMVYIRVSSRSAGARLAVFAILAAAVFCIAGAASIVFALVCAAEEVMRHRSRWLSAVYTLAAVAAGAGLHALTPSADIWSTLALLFPPAAGSGAAHAGVAGSLLLWAYFPLATLVAGAWGQKAAAAKPAPRKARKARKHARQQPPPPSKSMAGLILPPAAIVLVTAAVIWAGYDSPRRPSPGPSAKAARQPEAWFQALGETRGFHFEDMSAEEQLWFKIRYYSQCRRWSDVLDAARKLPGELYDPQAACHVNRALYHLGRLPYDMFCYPQENGTDTLLLSSPMLVDAFWFLDGADIWFELGQINVAEQGAHEAMGQCNDHPEIFKRLARMNLLKGNVGGARLFLTAMQRWPEYAEWAKEYLRQVEAGTVFSADSELAEIRERMNTKQDKTFGAIGPLSPGELLDQLLACNPHNRMAFEYLMGMFLLGKHLDSFATDIVHLNDFGYTEIPPLYQEAMLIYNSKHTDKPVAVPGKPISEETYTRSERFARLFDAAARAPEPQRRQAFEQLRAEFGNTYFYYYAMGRSGSGGLGSRSAGPGDAPGMNPGGMQQ